MSFAIIAEGATDQAVIENVLCGFFQTDADTEADDPVVNFVQPPRTAKGHTPAPGGWTLVFQSLKAGEHRAALQHNDYVIVHIDTDRSGDVGFDVSHQGEDGQPLKPEQLIERVVQRLIMDMDPVFCGEHAARIVFAIAVDSIDCWLLPLLYSDEAAKQGKLTGCLAAANAKLQRLGRPSLSKAGDKILSSYDLESRGYLKRRTLAKHRGKNASLDVFVKNLERVASRA